MRPVLASITCSAALLVATAAVEAGSTQYLMVVDSGNDRVMLFDPFDGSLVEETFIDIAGNLPGDLTSGTPKQAIQVDDQVWISDQLRSRIDRFSIEGDYIDSIGGGETDGMSNIRGLMRVGDTVYVANNGTANDAPGQSILTLDLDGNITGNFAVSGSPWSPIVWGDNLLLSFSGAGSRIDEISFDGQVVGTFHQGSANFIQQINANSLGGVYAAAFSGLTTRGIYQYDADGAQVNFWNVGPARGVHELGNGLVLWADGVAVDVLDPATGVTVSVFDGAGSFQFISPLEIPDSGIVGDLNGDGVVDVSDMLLLLADWGPCEGCAADLNGDGVVDVSDLLILLANWG